AGAADDCPDYGIAGYLIEHIAGRRVAAKKRKQRAGYAGEKASHHEGDQAQNIDVETDQRSPQVVIANGQKGLSERASDHAVHQEKTKRDYRQHEEILQRSIGEAEGPPVER